MFYNQEVFIEQINKELEEMNITKKEFAAKCDITAETLARITSKTNPIRPSRNTLKKISKITKATYEELLLLSNYTEPTDFLKMEINKRAEYNIEIMQKGFSELCERPRFYDSIKSFLNEYRMLYSKENIEFSIGKKQEYEGEWHKNSEYCCPVCVRFRTNMQECRTFTVIYFCETIGGKFIPIDFATDGKSLVDAMALPVGADDYLYEHGVKIENLPYYYELMNCNKTSEEKLLKAIFGEKDSDIYYLESLKGFGMILNEVPDNFVKFIENHKESFIKGQAEQSAYDKILNNKINEALEEYCDDETWDSGVGAFVAKIMRIETGLDVEWHKGENDADSCVMVTSDSEDYVPRELRSIFYPYAKELGLESFGSCVTYINGLLDANEIFYIN